ncbi:hypothetical protein [Streptomyces sp. NPDC093984]|uniref:hypothetical protein n=1 Tax=Streptomyces sp. NPDC093984 TaxID=3366052 RepID=UPI0037F2C597
MPNNTQRVREPGTLDTDALRRKLTRQVWWTGIRNGGIYAIMAFGGPALGAALTRAGLSWVFIVMGPITLVGIVGFFATLGSIPVAITVTRSCRKALAQYSFDAFWPQITKVDGAQATKGRPKNMTLALRTGECQESPLMRMIPVPRRVPWRNPWPKGIERGVYVAGDLPFGAVGYVPGSAAFFIMQPEDWETAAQDRKLAAPDRVTRAQDAGLTRRII